MPKLTLIPSFPPSGTKIKQIVSGVEHSLVLLSNGEVYGWGNGRKGQLGILEPGIKFLWQPTKIQMDKPDFEVASIAAGREFSAFISREGEVYVIGNDKWGVIKQNSLTKSPGWRSFGAGWGAIYILGEDGRVTSWGRNTHGQLPPSDIPELEKLAVGSEHAIGVGEDGKLYIWGWGEHGNCGPLKEDEGEIVKWRNEVRLGNWAEGSYRIEGIAAGCATSWVWLTEMVN
ncbi:hypothetical protein ABW19_dt0208931 [Dactylella cylindrospora]|nr:hypothetical protein ABW19_dt0208931 [Dactylella cylindrospora]